MNTQTHALLTNWQTQGQHTCRTQALCLARPPNDMLAYTIGWAHVPITTPVNHLCTTFIMRHTQQCVVQAQVLKIVQLTRQDTPGVHAGVMAACADSSWHPPFGCAGIWQ
jgi:hypothetical protein